MKALIWIGCLVLANIVKPSLGLIGDIVFWVVVFAIPSWICKQIDNDKNNTIYNYYDIQHNLPQTMTERCKEYAGNRERLEEYVRNCVSMGLVEEKYVMTIVEHFAAKK